MRIEFAGARYHVASRGDRREAIFEDDEDRERFLESIWQGLREQIYLGDEVFVTRMQRQAQLTGSALTHGPRPDPQILSSGRA